MQAARYISLLNYKIKRGTLNFQTIIESHQEHLNYYFENENWDSKTLINDFFDQDLDNLEISEARSILAARNFSDATIIHVNNMLDNGYNIQGIKIEPKRIRKNENIEDIEKKKGVREKEGVGQIIPGLTLHSELFDFRQALKDLEICEDWDEK